VISHVLVPLDDSPLATRALEHALASYPEASITVLHVIDYIEESYSAKLLVGEERLRERAEEKAERLFEDARELAAEYDREVDTATVVGKPSREIVAYADEHDVDLVVIGSHSRPPLSRVLLGTVAESVVRRASTPVTVIR
jgi:nucleotide-binding universal stress UspA family protein